jgi:AraC-like DNA-binding protein
MVTVYPHAHCLVTDDISAVNNANPPDTPRQAYPLRPGPLHFTALQVAVDPDLRIGRWSCTGAVRTFSALASDVLHISFPTGKALRVEGLAVDEDVVTLNLGSSPCAGSTLQHVECDELVLSGTALAALCAGAPGLLESLSARFIGKMSVMRVRPAAQALHGALRQTLDTCAAGLARSGPLSTAQQAIVPDFPPTSWRRSLDERLRTMLEDALTCEDLLARRAGHRRHALAREAERLIWQRVASGQASGLSLDELCADLGTTRRTLQLAFQDHFATSIGMITRSARLQRVRAELGSGAAAAVSEAALRGGFEHLGRFARYYRDFFGESPSATLRGRQQRSGTA